MTKSAAPRMNVKLLRKIQKHILEEPRRFVMRKWFGRGKPNADNYDADGGDYVTYPACGTAACIGGWAVLLSGEKARAGEMLGNKAARLLGLPPLGQDDDAASNRLFLTSNWPNRFVTAFRKAQTPLTRARIAAKRIDHFISTKGAE